MNVGEVSYPLTNREFNKHIASSRMSLGMFGEMLVGADCADKGYIVLFPHHPTSKYDMVVDRDGVLIRIQVKVSAKSKLSVNLGVTKKDSDYSGWNSFKAPLPKKIPKYKSGDFDYLAIVDRTARVVYYVPAEDIDFENPNFFIKSAEAERYLSF